MKRNYTQLRCTHRTSCFDVISETITQKKKFLLENKWKYLVMTVYCGLVNDNIGLGIIMKQKKKLAEYYG